MPAYESTRLSRLSIVLRVVAFLHVAGGALLFTAATPVAWWTSLGVLVFVIGIALAFASAKPLERWWIVGAGLLSDIVTISALAIGMFLEATPVIPGGFALAGFVVLTLSLLVIAWGLFQELHSRGTVHTEEFHSDDPLRELTSHTGQSPYDLSFERPQLMVFLRHSGCTFCREALADLRSQRAEIERRGVGVVLIHLDAPEQMLPLIAKNQLDDLPQISDPRCQLFAQVGLESGTFRQLMGLRVILRGAKVALFDGHGFGAITANPLQMPGAFVMRDGRFIHGCQHEFACDRPDYRDLVEQALALERTAEF